MGLINRLRGRDLLLTRPVSERIEKTQGGIQLHWDIPDGFGVGLVILCLVAFAVILYVTGNDEAGRVVIDLAVLFFGWATGRKTGETAGIKRMQG